MIVTDIPHNAAGRNVLPKTHLGMLVVLATARQEPLSQHHKLMQPVNAYSATQALKWARFVHKTREMR
jgi:hypothetical protein